MGSVHNLTSLGDFQKALQDPTPMIIDCYATWCGPCKVIAPKVVEFAKTYDSARFFKLDVDEVPEVAQELGIRAMPTFVVFKNGELFETVVGMNPPGLEAAVKKSLE
ncbi:Cytoplasmic thioredoxin isoenzyme 2 [Agyrium rufum]|nr:Cytoplasmic thioredoxin isoenzyme 2 [Agyrium rufum]